MGAGKCTALAAAREAGLETVEIDELMERELGKPIRQAFEEDGEEAFRAREAEVVGALLEQADGGAIALGGGSVLSERVRKALDRHIVVWLEIDAAEAWRRIEGTERPLATSEGDVERLLAERLPLYEELADAVVPMADSERRRAGRCRRSRRWRRCRRGRSCSGPRARPATTRSSSARASSTAGWWPLAGPRASASPTATSRPLFAERLEPLAAAVEVEPGEGAKTMGRGRGGPARARRAGDDAAKTTSSPSAAASSATSPASAPTSTSAGSRSSTCRRRWSPRSTPPTAARPASTCPRARTTPAPTSCRPAVLADTATLATLPPPELAAGFVEALKTGLLAGGALWERVRAIEQLDPGDLDDVVFACARYKCEVVAADERDAGLRNVLNLGHTVGHAIEAASGYARYRHGEAIGLGLLAALRLSEAPELRDEVEAILRRHGLPVDARPGDRRSRTSSTPSQHDKKRTAAGVGFVLLSEPGKPRTGQLVDPAKVRAAVEELYDDHRQQPRRRPARGQLRRARAARPRDLRRPLARASWRRRSPTGRTSWGSNRSSSRPTPRASSANTCTARPSSPTRRSSTPAPGPTTAARSPTRWS